MRDRTGVAALVTGGPSGLGLATARALAAEAPPEVVDSITSDASFPCRFGQPEDFADLCRSMIQNPMLNGEVIRLDAGVRLRAR